MEYTIAHETSYWYPQPVVESYTVVHLQPRNDATQYCTRFELSVKPRAGVRSTVDRYGNGVQHFEILSSHQELTVRASSTVVSLAPRTVGEPSEASLELLRSDPELDLLYDFVQESAYVQFAPEVAGFAADLAPRGDRIGAWCGEVSRAIHRRLRYDTTATSVRSTVVEALQSRAGVCQDFAHVMIAVLRSAGIPARYVSGYVFRGETAPGILGAEASHAWCEAYLPPYGWVGFDPTNDVLVNDQFVRVAIGRDYHDVSPVRGVYKGSGSSEMSVNVAMDALQFAQQ